MALNPTDSSPDVDRHLLIRAGPHRYAIPARVVRRVVQMPDLYRVPGATPQLLGVGQYGGEPLAIVDVEGLDHEAGDVSGSRNIVVVIAPAEELLIGLAVDEASQVARLPEHRAPEGRSGSPISVADGEGIKRQDPSWFLARDDVLTEESGPESS